MQEVSWKGQRQMGRDEEDFKEPLASILQAQVNARTNTHAHTHTQKSNNMLRKATEKQQFHSH